MKLFENKVGRPSNEILKKRRMFIVSIAIAIVAVLTIGAYALSNLNLGNLRGASYTKGQKISLKNAQIYVSEKIKIRYAKKTGTFYIYNTTIKNNRIRISSRKNGISLGWVAISDIKPATATTTAKTTASKFTKNEKVKLSNAAIYVSSSIKTKMGTKNGEFYIYNANVSNNRIRISSKKNGTSLGWVNVSSIRKVNEQQNSNITSKYQLGDVNMNGKLDEEDCNIVMLVSSGEKTLTADQKILADMNKDGSITTVDSRLILIKITLYNPEPSKKPTENTTSKTTAKTTAKPTVTTTNAKQNIATYSITKNSVIKTDAKNALPPITKSQLVDIINKAGDKNKNVGILRTGNRKQNALKYVDKILEIQDKYKVHALFTLAVAVQESGVGTVGCAKYNNWFSIMSSGKCVRYSDVSTNIDKFGNLIANGTYYFKKGKITPKQIGPTYCCTGWDDAVTSHMNSLLKWIK